MTFHLHRRAVCLALCLTLAWLLALGCAPARAGAQDGDLPLVRLEFGEHSVVAQAPITPSQRIQGLGGRKSLAPGQGMLFIFSGPPLAMCMRGMNFALDFIWINQGEVSQISPDIPPDGGALTVRAQGQAQMVLEVPGGWAREHGVRVGQKVRFTPLDDQLPSDLRRVLTQEKP